MKMLKLNSVLLGLAANCCSVMSVNAQTIYMNESTSQVITQGNSVACSYYPSSTATTANSYYRVFTISDYVTANYFNVDSIQFSVEQANSAGSGAIPLTINLYSLSGTTVSLANLTLLNSFTGYIGDVVGGQVFTANLTANLAGTGKLVVEIASADGGNSGESFNIGSNSLGQTKPSYILASSCGFNDITDLSSSLVGTPTPMDLLISVYGKGSTVAPPPPPGPFTNPATTVCTGSSDITYTVPNVPGTTYNWSYSGTGVTVNPATVANSNSFSLDFSDLATSGVLSVSGTTSSGTSNALSIIVNVNASSLTTPYLTYINDSTLSCPSNGGTSYAWYRNGIVIPGATSSTYTMTQGGDYNARIFAGNCNLNSDIISVGDALGDYINPVNPVCLSSTAHTTVTYTVPPNSIVTDYNWTYSGTGATITSPSWSNVATIDFAPGATSGYLNVTYDLATMNGSGMLAHSLPRLLWIDVTAAPIVSISRGGNVLTAPAGFASYTWYKDNIAITGATASTYTMTQNGAYFVKVTNAGGCVGTSDVANVTDVHPSAIGDVANDNMPFSVYPNPTKNSFVVAVDNKMGNSVAVITLTDISGRVLMHQNATLSAGKQLVQVNVAAFKDGIYFVTVSANGYNGTQKLVIVK